MHGADVEVRLMLPRHTVALTRWLIIEFQNDTARRGIGDEPDASLHHLPRFKWNLHHLPRFNWTHTLPRSTSNASTKLRGTNEFLILSLEPNCYILGNGISVDIEDTYR